MLFHRSFYPSHALAPRMLAIGPCLLRRCTSDSAGVLASRPPLARRGEHMTPSAAGGRVISEQRQGDVA